MANEQLPTYKKPPLAEVTIGARYTPFPSFKAAHIGLLWERFRKDFPSAEQVVPIAELGAYPPADPVTGLPYPRTWFVNPAESRLIQFQADRFYYNWRVREGEPEYPRFPEISQCFFTLYRWMEEWAAGLNLGTLDIVGLGLAYTNHIVLDENRSAADVAAELVPGFAWNGSGGGFLPAPSNVGWHLAFPIEGSSDQLSVRLSEGVRASDSSKLLTLELSVNGRPADTSIKGLSDWLNVAHVWTVKGFENVTNSKLQREHWGLTDEHSG